VLFGIAFGGDRAEFALAMEDADPVRRTIRGGSAPAARLTDGDELAAYHAARYLLRLAGAVLEQADQRTLDLEGQREQIQAVGEDVEQARAMAILLHRGLTWPEDGKPARGLPTPAQAAAWQQLRELEHIRGKARQRDEAAARRYPGGEPTPWTASSAGPDGYFTARRADGLALGGWAETAEGIPDTLRAWSVPFGSPVTVAWSRQPPRPHGRRRWCGWPESVRPPEAELWEAESPGRLAAFAAALAGLRDSWPGGDLRARLAEAAARLNAEEPQAPSLDELSCGGSSQDGNVTLGVTAAAEWINPAAIACTGTARWNKFDSHRPGQVALIASALLGDGDPAAVADLWAEPSQPVSLLSVPGPAGPLYELHSNGMHRMHTARLLGFPLLWAVVEQFTLPTTVAWYSAAAYGERLTDEVQDSIMGCWRGALRRGLIDGELDEAEGILYPTWALAPWLLARPDSAAAWAGNYERAYPGALAAAGVHRGAWQTSGQWRAWLTGDV
jgi:hypothetical protein